MLVAYLMLVAAVAIAAIPVGCLIAADILRVRTAFMRANDTRTALMARIRGSRDPYPVRGNPIGQESG